MHKKQRMIGALMTIGIQAVLGTVSVFLFFGYYKELTTTEGTVQAYNENLDIQINIPEIQIKTNQKENNSSYQGAFGTIAIVSKNTKKDVFDYNEKKTNIIKLDKEKIYLYHLVSKRLENGIIDSKVAIYILQSKNPEQIIKDVVFLSAYGPKLVTDKDIPSKNIIKVYASLIQNGEYKELITTLKNLETMVDNQLRKPISKLTLAQERMSTESRTYIQNKFVFDDANQYRGNIDLVANLLQIDRNLLKSAIIGEQVRGFFTYRGVAKKIITDNFGVMRMGQGSYGVGGVKLETAKKVLQYAQINEKSIFDKYLQRNRTDQELKDVLQDSQDSFYQVLFAGLTIKEINTSWEAAGQGIEKKPGIILTLYNIGNKPPRANPEVGGAVIDIDGQTWSFGSLGMLMYYWLEIYG